MKPISLEIENLRSFKERRLISFVELELFAILGDTGAGKTSILEAITYALFNRSTWDGSKVKELISKGKSMMSVTFVFSVDSIEYTITRITKERGQAIHRLQCPTRGIDLTAERQINTAIEEALHLDAEAFLHTVLLPQGKHDELLTKDESKRNRILSELFRLDDLSKVAALAKFHEGRADSFLHSTVLERGRFAADPSEAIANAETDILNAADSLKAANDALEQTKVLDVVIAEKVVSLGQIAHRITQMAGVNDVSGLLASISERDESLNAQERAQRQVLEAASQSKIEAEAKLQSLVCGKIDQSNLARYESMLDSIENEAAEIKREESDKVRREAAYAEASAIIADIETRLIALDEGYQTARANGFAASKLVEHIRPKKESLESLIAIRAAAVVEQATRNKELSAKRQALVGADDLIRAATEAVIQLEIEQTNAVSSREKAEIAAGVEAIAAHLHAGDDCPVCERALPSDFTARKSPDMQKVKLAEANARKKLSAAENAKTRLEATVNASREAEAECLKHVRYADARVEVATKSLIDTLDDASADPETVLKTLVNEIDRLEKSLPHLRNTYDQANRMLNAAQTEHATKQQEVKSHIEAVTSLSASLSKRREKIRKQIVAVPDVFSPAADLSEIKKARQAIKSSLSAAVVIENAVKIAMDSIGRTTFAINEIERNRSTAVIGPRSRLYERLNAIAKILGIAECPDEEASQSAWASDVVGRAGDEVGRLQVFSEAEKAIQKIKTEERRAIVWALGAEPQDAITMAKVAQRDAEASLRSAENAAKRVGELAATIAKLEPAKVSLTTLKDKLGARNFPSFATELRQQRLLQCGSQILKDMTRGRYEFTRDFAILDNDTNEPRQPQTLSGGEKFLASLALSLAVVEIAASGGAKIESLFLDEGFASLDAETLEMAMIELKKRSRKGRMICVISHLSQVTKFVADTFVVKASDSGTQIAHIEGPIDDEDDVVQGLVSQLALRA